MRDAQGNVVDLGELEALVRRAAARLTPGTRDVWALLASQGSGVNRSVLARLATARGITVEGSRLTGDTLLSVLGELSRAGLARGEHGAYATYAVPEPIRTFALEDAHERGVLLDMIGSRERDRMVGTVLLGSEGYARDLRVACITGDRGAAARAIAARFRWDATTKRKQAAWMVEALGAHPRTAWLELLAEASRDLYLEGLYRHSIDALLPVPAAALDRGAGRMARELRATYRVLRGERRDDDDFPTGTRARLDRLAAFWAGDRAAALASLGKRKPSSLHSIEGVCLALARVEAAASDPSAWQVLRDQLSGKGAGGGENAVAAQSLRLLVRAVDGEKEALLRSSLNDLNRQTTGWLPAFVRGLVVGWIGGDIHHTEGAALISRLGKLAKTGGYGPVARELSTLAAVLTGQHDGTPALATAYRTRPEWEVALHALRAIADAEGASKPAPRGERIIWEVRASHGVSTDVFLQPRHLKSQRSKRGTKVALKRLLTGALDCASEVDRAVIGHVRHITDGWYRHKTSAYVPPEALVELIDHPHVVDEEGEPLTVARGEPSVEATTKGDATWLRIHPAELADANVVIDRDGDKLTVYRRTPALQRVAQIIGGQGVEVPDEGRALLGTALGALSGTVRVGAGEDVEVAAEEVPADPQPVAWLRFAQKSLQVRLRVTPLGIGGPKLQPGRGGANVTAKVGDKALRTRRDLAAERALLDTLVQRCPVLEGWLDDAHELRTDDLETALDIMLELSRLGTDARVVWQGQERLHVPALATASRTTMRVSTIGDYLSVDVDVPVDEKLVMRFQELLAAPRTDGGRYIVLDEGRFLALSRELRQQLDTLAQLGRVTKKGAKIPPVAWPLIDQIAATMGAAKLDRKTTSQRKRWEDAMASTPRVPRGFGQVLRDYQRDGLAWMSRLAALGLGACLADDMGLGKTVQALALLVARAKEGPALVVAPTSVASNWIDEAKRFAPSLEVHALTTSSRAKALEDLGGGALVVCSYGILRTASEALAAQRWGTVVFDEAHALKNASTQQAKAAFSLEAGFRLALTGTPIENHLGELWSLFKAIVPGLLGSERQFVSRYAQPIASGDRERSAQLRQLVRPFILRRTKAEVLDELPERTETTVKVTPSEAERAYYEALRRQALTRLDAAEKAGEENRLNVLAEITTLRQAAIDPRLVEEDAPAGAKLEALGARLRALVDEGHRALVFSQFLGSLAAVRALLERLEIRHLHLDGSTAARTRKKRIAAFQAGEADVFVMSLKAGGVGVNLTAADYVIHLDPWWNPAVEDQASSRVHRIGQKRPVSIYRLVTEGTIEEKILALHRDKRALADDLLGGLDQATKLDLDELRALISS